MVIKIIDNKDLWDKHVDESSYGTLFHKWDFLKIIERHSGYKLYPYGAYRGDELVCIFPLFIKNFLGLKSVVSPPPDLAVPYLGFVMGETYDKLKQRRKEAYVNSVMDEMEAEMRKVRASSMSISTVNGFVDMRPFKWNGYHVEMRYSYVIDLKQPLDAIRGNFDERLRREIDSADKQSLFLEPADNVDEFYRALAGLHRQHRLHGPVPPREFLRDVLATFPENVKIGFLRQGGETVDVVAYYQYKKRFAFWMGWGTSTNLVHNAFTAWHLIKSKKSEGLETMEINGLQERELCFFKSMFNAPLEYSFSITKKDLLGAIAAGSRSGFAVT